MVLLDPTRSGNSIFNLVQVLIIHEDSEENHHLKGGSEIGPLLPSVPRILPPLSYFSRVQLSLLVWCSKLYLGILRLKFVVN